MYNPQIFSAISIKYWILFAADLNRGLDKRHISTKFSNFVTESDQESINLLREEFQIEDFENHFDPEDNIFHSSSLDDENIKEIGMYILSFQP